MTTRYTQTVSRDGNNIPDHEYESEVDDCDNWPTNEEERRELLKKETERIRKAQQSADKRFGK